MNRIVTFTNLFPSAELPTHGLFVQERMRRVAAALGCDWRVVAPVPQVPRWLRFGIHRRWSRVPRVETVAGVEVRHPRYRHWPLLSMRHQAIRMQRGAAAAVAELLRDCRGLVLDAHYLWPDGVAAAAIAAELRVPVVLTARGSDLNVLARDPFVREQIRRAAATAFACCAVSGALADRFAAVAELPRERILVMPNGVDLDRFRPGDAREARLRLGLPADGRLLLAVGRLVVGKRFVQVARLLRELPADVRLVVVGEGPERARIQRAGGGRVLLLGNQPPDVVADACRAADLCVLPSEREGWPNVVGEALASGLRVVATAVGGIPEILGIDVGVESPLGALVPPGDEAALRAALQRLLSTRAEPARVRAFAERLGWPPVVGRLGDLFTAAFAHGVAA